MVLMQYLIYCNNLMYNIKVDETDMWHQKLRHLKFKNLTKDVNTRAMLGVSKLNKKNLEVYDACQLRK